jgi:hypothetical protein
VHGTTHAEMIARFSLRGYVSKLTVRHDVVTGFPIDA